MEPGAIAAAVEATAERAVDFVKVGLFAGSSGKNVSGHSDPSRAKQRLWA